MNDNLHTNDIVKCGVNANTSITKHKTVPDLGNSSAMTINKRSV